MVEPFPFLRLPCELQIEVLSHYFESEHALVIQVYPTPQKHDAPTPESRVVSAQKTISEVSHLLIDPATKAVARNFEGRLLVEVSLPLIWKLEKLFSKACLDFVPFEKLKVIEIKPLDARILPPRMRNSFGFLVENRSWQNFAGFLRHPKLVALETVRFLIEDENQIMLPNIRKHGRDAKDHFLGQKMDASFIENVDLEIQLHLAEEEETDLWSNVRRYDGSILELEFVVSQSEICGWCTVPGHVDLTVTFALEAHDRLRIKGKTWISKPCASPQV